MNEHASVIRELAQTLLTQASGLETLPPRTFGYRERMQLERPLFLILKTVSLFRLGYELHGLSDVHRTALHEHLERSDQGADVKAYVRDVCELYVFLRSLSAANPYVQGDALSRVAATRRHVIALVVRRLRSITDNTFRFSSEVVA